MSMFKSTVFANHMLAEKNRAKPLSITFFSLAKASLQVPLLGLPFAILFSITSLICKGIESISKKINASSLALQNRIIEGYKIADDVQIR